MRNISNFEKILKRGRLLEGDGLVSNKVDFEMDAGPDQMPVQSTNNFCDAIVLLGLSNGTYSVPWGQGYYNAYERVLYSLQLFDVGIRYNKE